MRFGSVEEYLAAASPEAREVLERIRGLVARVVPEAEAVISYQMLGFRRGKVFAYAGGFKGHVGVYPPVRGDAGLEAELSGYRGEKGNLRFPFQEPVPWDLVERVIRALARQRGIECAP